MSGTTSSPSHPIMYDLPYMNAHQNPSLWTSAYHELRRLEYTSLILVTLASSDVLASRQPPSKRSLFHVGVNDSVLPLSADPGQCMVSPPRTMGKDMALETLGTLGSSSIALHPILLGQGLTEPGASCFSAKSQ